MSLFENFARITPFLWFDNNAEEAADFYVSVFKNSRRLGEMRSAADNPATRAGGVLTVSFELDGQRFTAMNGGPGHKFTDAISLVVLCESQEEIDYYWGRLTEGEGAEVACGWLKDKFGLSWQIVPANMGDLVKSPKAFQAMMDMKKLDIAALRRAAE
jgi:predicted 3-demethylubiquinone-9 3-methyltransferase (glyoxalase superfamily)